MWRDEIVDEVRRERDKIAARYDYDLEKLFEAMREEETRSGTDSVSLPPREPSMPSDKSGAA